VAASRAALIEMRRQVGTGLLLDDEGLARRGLIVRLLVLPADLAALDRTLAWVAEVLGTGTWLSLMSQYAPYHRALGHELLGRRTTAAEYREAVAAVRRLGFSCYFLQHPGSQDACVPDFERERPFRFEVPPDSNRGLPPGP
jgi:putative pyruvate formate lyase activating enzyme